jgi:hypothetical protein
MAMVYGLVERSCEGVDANAVRGARAVGSAKAAGMGGGEGETENDCRTL